MSLTKQDLGAIKRLIDDSIDERVPRIIDERVPAIIYERLNDQVPKIMQQIVQPMLNRLEKRFTVKIDQLTLDVGQFSLETTDNFIALHAHMDDLDDGLAKVVEMTDNNRVELRKLKQRLSTT